MSDQKELIESPELLTVEKIYAEGNQEIRRVMLERYGWDRYLTDVEAKELHTDECGTLLQIDLADDENPARFVRVIDNSTNRQYSLRVPPDIQTAREAVAWTFDVPPEQYSPRQ